MVPVINGKVTKDLFMKPLLSKTTKPFLIYVLVILTISVPVYYWVINVIWENELDEHNKIIAENTIYELNHMNLSDRELEKSIQLWNRIQPNTNLRKLAPNDRLEDSVYTIIKQKNHSQIEHIDRFRCFSTIAYLNEKPYRFIAQTNIEETEEIIVVIALITVIFFILIVIGLLFLTRKLSQTVWKLFHNTLDKLKKFNLHDQSNIMFEKTDTIEFEELNQAIAKLIEHNINVYKTQKEFTENASHELQTPLAILKNKLDILLQSDDLTERQYHIAEEMNITLNRSARINKNLLLLTKIESHQFDDSETISFDKVVHQSIALFREHFERKKINITTQIDDNITVKGNSSLTEILINNLLLNAIRYTLKGGKIIVTLSNQSFQVANSGAESLDKELIFKRFVKFSNGNKNGSGLGLSIVQKIVDFQQWRITYHFENKKHIFTVKI